MTLYVLIILCLSLVGVTGLQFFYLTYLERIEKSHKRRIHELERQCQMFRARLRESEQQLAKQADLLDAAYEGSEDEEIWADVIEDR